MEVNIRVEFGEYMIENGVEKGSPKRNRSTTAILLSPLFAGRLVGGEKGPYSIPLSVLLPDNIYLHKLDKEIGRIREKYEISRIRSVLLRT
ncbi:maturase, putative [Medicago truncatula]|uniref:Maturase, putative n=1 Tax=Medicago truncatula TaxID=3880 RepID=G7JM80_MEDTR|nr:maturase, putative [Medicago truncatula]